MTRRAEKLLELCRSRRRRRGRQQQRATSASINSAQPDQRQRTGCHTTRHELFHTLARGVSQLNNWNSKDHDAIGYK